MYRYKAINNEGEYVEGEMNLPSEDLVVAELVKLEYVPIKITAARQVKSRKFRLTRATKFEEQPFFENLYDYMDSGLSIDKALELEAYSQNVDGKIGFISSLLDEVREGGNLSAAMKNYPEHFSPLSVGVIHVGEETDSLAESLSLLADLAHDLQEFKQKIKSALIYPAILTAVMFISILVLFGFVIPRFKSLFDGMGIQMSGLTEVIVGISDIMTNQYEIMLIVILLMIFIIRYMVRTIKSNSSWAMYLLRMPLIGSMIQQYNLYIISKILQILIKKKITIINALDHIQEALDNIVYKNEIAGMTREISRGKSLKQALNEDFFTRHFIYLVGVGEETGRMAEAFAKLSRFYYKQLDNRIKSLMTYAEPVIIMLLGLIVGLIVVSMLQAILSINELAV